jgi:hypothetical protein
MHLYITAAIGLMVEYECSKVIGKSAAERDSFLKKVEELLKKHMFACMRFDWNNLFSLHSSKFKSVNFVKKRFENRAFHYKFPAFSNVNLDASLNAFCNYKQSSAALEEPYHEEED